MRIRHQVVKAIRDFFDNNGFTLIDSPIFTSNAVEGTTTLFEVDYFERSAYLTQSGQLYQEAGATAFGKTYCFGPCFRAEKSKTRRHLTEFWMVEPELVHADLDDLMDLAAMAAEPATRGARGQRGRGGPLHSRRGRCGSCTWARNC